MIDPFGRTITYLRVSVTDRCDFRCVYCMAEEMTFLPKKELLPLEELDRVCSAFIRLGVKDLRLRGGEPLVRRDIMTLFRALGRHIREGSLEELTLTTNGSQLSRYADELRQCGVRRVNVSSSSAPVLMCRPCAPNRVMMSRRTSGSPPVRRNFLTPSRINVLHTRSSSSSVRSSCFGRNVISSAMQ